MSACFNKKTWFWMETSNPSTDLPAPLSDWVIDPIFSPDFASCQEVGPNCWVYEADGQTIRPMTAQEMDSNTTLLAEAIANKGAAINALRDQKLYGGFTDSNGIAWDSTAQSISNLNAVVSLITAGVITQNVTWRSSNNTNYSLTPAQVIQLGAGLAAYGQNLYNVSWAHKANLAALTSVSAVDAYDITTNW